MIQQSFCYPLFLAKTQKPIDLFRAAKKMGYAATEFWARDDNFHDLCRAAQEVGLKVASFSAHGTLTDGLNKRSNHARIEDEVAYNVELAKQYGVAGLICFSGNSNEGQSDEDAREATAEGLRKVAPYAERAGVNLNLELLNSKVDTPVINATTLRGAWTLCSGWTAPTSSCSTTSITCRSWKAM
jgi:hydroxypyruvate isomerase